MCFICALLLLLNLALVSILTLQNTLIMVNLNAGEGDNMLILSAVSSAPRASLHNILKPEVFPQASFISALSCVMRAEYFLPW